jgi:uncharacterized protein (DUF488 family)
MMTIEIVTIGVYGSEEEAFFQALQEARVDTFLDVRQRRGVRGAQYAFVNSQRLQEQLGRMGIRYLHLKEYAPSPALRARQKEADKASKAQKRKRSGLSPAFIEGYRQECLDTLKSEEFLDALAADTKVVALFCVEQDPAACHRSLLAERLEEELGVPVTHITP